MADDRGQDLMGYAAMEQEASRGVIKAALRRAALPPGLPGNHHLYISFRTKALGVSIPPDLMARYPEEMTIVLQHQFWDLEVGETFFSVMLKFNGDPKTLKAPYTAVTRFYDPSVPYMLQFETAPGEAAPASPSSGPHEVVPLRPRGPVEVAALAPPAPAAPHEEPAAQKPEDGPSPPDGPKIVSLDTFRKK